MKTEECVIVIAICISAIAIRIVDKLCENTQDRVRSRVIDFYLMNKHKYRGDSLIDAMLDYSLQTKEDVRKIFKAFPEEYRQEELEEKLF